MTNLKNAFLLCGIKDSPEDIADAIIAIAQTFQFNKNFSLLSLVIYPL